MKQITLRVEEQLADDLKAAAAERKQSVNAFAASALRAAVDPEYAADGVEAARARLARAGILHVSPPYTGPVPSEEALERAREQAAKGTPLSDLISEGRGPK